MLVFAAAALLILLSGRLGGDFRIDEVHKLGETYFLRLVESGDFRNPDWLGSRVERSNPPVGKVLFGLAIQLSGQPLPSDLRLATLTEHGRPLPPPELDAQVRGWLRPVRIFVLLVTAATATLVFLAGAYATDHAGGLVCAALYMTNFLTQTFATTAVFDSLLTLFITAAAVIALMVRRDAAAAIAASLAAALAFDVRVTGLVALGGVLVIFAVQRR